MASVAFHNFNQFRAEGRVKLFGEYNGYGAGEQTRDFVSVEDVVKVNLFFFDHPDRSGIFNLGTGRAQPFNDIASTVVNSLRAIDGEAPLPLADAGGARTDRRHPVPRCAARQVSVLHAGGPVAAARRRLRCVVPLRAGRRRSLCALAIRPAIKARADFSTLGLPVSDHRGPVFKGDSP